MDKQRCVRCKTKMARTWRKSWRFGDVAKGEGPIVESVVLLCKRCAERWDDNVADMTAEARAS